MNDNLKIIMQNGGEQTMISALNNAERRGQVCCGMFCGACPFNYIGIKDKKVRADFQKMQNEWVETIKMNRDA